MTIRVVLAEDYDVMRDGLRQIIESTPDLELIGVCEEFDSLVSVLESELPDVLLTDIRMPPTWAEEGIRASERLRTLKPQAGVVVLSNHDDPSYVYEFFRGGTARRAYLLKERWGSAKQIVTAIREVSSGGSLIDPKVVDALVEARSWEKSSPLRHLTQREREVLSQMAQGKNNRAVATSLSIGARAVEHHINSIFAKLGVAEETDVDRRVKAVLLFLGKMDPLSD